jgi:sugar phosphate isomerase/epimerase
MSFEIGFCLPLSMGDPSHALPRMRELGFDGIELWPDTLNRFGVDAWGDALAANGLRCVQLCPYFNFVHGPELIEKSRRTLDEYLDAAAKLNCRRLRVFTGPPWGAGVVGAHQANESQWSAAIESLRVFCDVAAKRGVELCLECHDGSLMEDSPSALRLLQSVDRKNLTTNLQLPLVNEAWPISVDALARYTTHIHIHNWVGEMGTSEITFLDQGTFDWETVLKRVIPQSPGAFCVSVEHVDHGGRDDPWTVAERDGRYLNKLRKKLSGKV